MKHLTCPHCYAEVPHGARVCRGCHAEVEYGPPGWLIVVLLIFSISFRSWVVGIGVFIIGLVLLAYIFKDRVVFKRGYKY